MASRNGTATRVFSEVLTDPDRVLVIRISRRAPAPKCSGSGLPFDVFLDKSDSSILRGYVRNWLRDVRAALDATVLRDLIEQSGRT